MTFSKKQIALMAAIFFSLLALLFMFILPFYIFNYGFGTTDISYIDITFGKTTSFFGIDANILGFSFGNLLILLLLLSAIILFVVQYMQPKKDSLIFAILLILVGVIVLVLISKLLFVRGTGVAEDYAFEEFEIATGAILTMVFSFLSAVTGAASIYLAKK